MGGTARSVSVSGFTFDFTGHLLHLHDPYTKSLIQELLKNNLYACERKAAVYSHGVLTPYPFQVNTYRLPDKVKSECVQGFKEAVQKYAEDKTRETSLPFSLWSLRTFGRGIHNHFMKSYNEKLWQVSLDQMTAQWCGMFVPQPKLEEVLRGSQEDFSKSFGYNVTFLYPQKGGIQVLPEALAKGLHLQLNTSLEEVCLKEKKVKLSDGNWLPYDFLVSSLPMVELLKRISDIPQRIKNLIPRLKWNSVLCFNLGVNRPNISDKSWIYYPEKKFVFYRVGFPMNFTPHATPKGCSSMYVEISHPGDKKVDPRDPALLKHIRKDLEKCGLLKKSDEILVTNIIPIRYAYVIYTLDRKEIMEPIFNFFKENNIFSIGRYGEWKYSFMEEAILDGKKTAEKIQTLLL
ncbi:MAG: FAD-dependent oxidoreductase [Elusimicrobia bacterium]|nr:FAD-dependent oxidoreductase [Elusimicrobiota bacterium]